MKKVLIINQKDSSRKIVGFVSILSNFILLLLFAGFIKFRIKGLIIVLNNFNEKLTILHIIKFLSHELTIFLIGILSLLGIIFWRNNKWFFFLTLFFVSTEITMVILAPSKSLFYTLKLLFTLTLIYIIIFRNIYNVYINKSSLKILFLLSGVFFYSALLFFIGILK